jgi:hypothetical protein
VRHRAEGEQRLVEPRRLPIGPGSAPIAAMAVNAIDKFAPAPILPVLCVVTAGPVPHSGRVIPFASRNCTVFSLGMVQLQGVILMRFQDETNRGRVSAWPDHAGLIHYS